MAIGSVALFKYHNGVSHVAMVEKFKDSCFIVSETNFDGEGSYGTRCVPYGDYSIVGFWRP